MSIRSQIVWARAYEIHVWGFLSLSCIERANSNNFNAKDRSNALKIQEEDVIFLRAFLITIIPSTSKTSTLEPSSMPNFLLSFTGMVICPLLVTETSVILSQVKLKKYYLKL